MCDPNTEVSRLTTTADTHQPSIDWSAQQLRVTIFHVGGDVGSAVHDFWVRAFGIAPQQDETRNLEGVRVVGAQASGKHWIANIRPDRVDLIQQPANTPNPGSGDVWNTFGGPYQQVARELIPPSHLLVDMVSGINRLAVGALFLAPATEIAEAFTELGTALPGLRFNDLDTPDFSFQVNRRRRSQYASGLWINRLATWSIAQNQTVSFGPVGSAGAAASTSEIRYAASLQLDINTAQIDGTRSIPNDKAKEILGELVDLSLEIADKGDIS